VWKHEHTMLGCWASEGEVTATHGQKTKLGQNFENSDMENYFSNETVSAPISTCSIGKKL